MTLPDKRIAQGLLVIPTNPQKGLGMFAPVEQGQTFHPSAIREIKN